MDWKADNNDGLEVKIELLSNFKHGYLHRYTTNDNNQDMQQNLQIKTNTMVSLVMSFDKLKVIKYSKDEFFNFKMRVTQKLRSIAWH